MFKFSFLFFASIAMATLSPIMEAILFILLPFSYFRGGVDFDLKSFPAVVLMSLIGFLGLVSEFGEPKVLTIFHFFVLVFFLGSVYVRKVDYFREVVLVFFVNQLVLLLMLAVGFFSDYFWDWFFFRQGDYNRFRGYYLEPSYLAIVCVFSLCVFSESRGRLRLIGYLLSIVFGILSLSLTFLGLILLVSPFIWPMNSPGAQAIIKKNILRMLSIGFILIVAYVIVGDSISFISDRLMGYIGFGHTREDYSWNLRISAPIEVIGHVLSVSPLWGLGVGVTDGYIIDNNHAFKYFNWYGLESVGEINNYYAYIFASGGMALALTYSYYLACGWTHLRKNVGIFSFLLFVPFFYGAFISIVPWYIVLLSRSLFFMKSKSNCPKEGSISARDLDD